MALVSVLMIPDLSLYAKAAEKRPISLIRDDEMEAFLKEISHPIFEAAGLDPDSISMIVISDPSINAFVTSGQKLFMHTGLMIQSEDAAGLMGVIAHETGHIKGAHIIQKGSNLRDASIGSIAGYVLGLGSVLAGAPPEAGMAIGTAGQNIATRNFLAYSRDYENAADTVALNVLKKIGISPKGLEGILTQLMQKQKLAGDLYDEYLLTHPVSEARINYVLNFIKQNPGVDKPTPQALERKFRMVKAKLKGFLEQPDAVRLFYQNRETPDAVYARAIALHREGKFQDSMALLEQLINSDPSNQYYSELKAQFLFERGSIEESITQYRKVLNVMGSSALIRLKLAEAYLATNKKENWRAAIGQLKAGLISEPRNVGVIEKLGIAYGKLDELGQSYLYLAESAIISGNKMNARRYIVFAEQKLGKNSPDASRLKELKKELDRLKDK